MRKPEVVRAAARMAAHTEVHVKVRMVPFIEVATHTEGLVEEAIRMEATQITTASAMEADIMADTEAAMVDITVVATVGLMHTLHITIILRTPTIQIDLQVG